jgi:membrane glycosyltransferase
MDQVVSDRGGAVARQPTGVGMPPEDRQSMPPQALASFDEAGRRRPAPPCRACSPGVRRLVVLGGAALLAGLAIYEMWLVLGVGGFSTMKVVVLGLFAVNVAWISLPFATSLVGLLRLAGGRRAQPSTTESRLSTRTAVLMPIHNEPPARVAAALDAMARDLVAQGEGGAFDIFLLSDTTRGDLALAEQQAVGTLRQRLGDAIRIHYRRRVQNTAHKSGNIRDFCERWGRAYDHLLVVDADSLMDGATMVTLARRMEADPDAGLIQTLPRLRGGTTIMARVQQFAGSVYGALLGSGLAWWASGESTFWGHNAILRTQAFLTSAGLPLLPGEPPFGGPILSHDFVEAALLRRAGWTVSIADDLGGSYEESPPSIIDLAVRDRRWCQGNLQHLRLVTTRGLHWVSRLHLVAGIFSYLSSPLWLLFVLAALGLGVHYEFARQQYFSSLSTLFPIWPRMDPQRAVELLAITLGILLGPKVFGLLAILLSPRRSRAFGGRPRLALGFLLEVLVSALIAPVQMLIHCGLVADVLRGNDSGWRPQRREDESLPWSQVLYRHRWHMVAGLLLSVAASFISWGMLAWVAPAVIGMLLAAPLSMLTGSAAVGRRVQRAGLLRTPEETSQPAIAAAAEAALPAYREALARTPSLVEVVSDRGLLERQRSFADLTPPPSMRDVDPVEASAEKKIRMARALEEAIEGLSPQEQARVVGLPTLLELIAGLPKG